MNDQYDRMAEDAISRIWNDGDATEKEAAACVSNLIHAAVDAERKACVEIARGRAHPQASLAVATTATSIADAIKARGTSLSELGE